MIVLSHSGKQHSYHTASCINELQLLDTFYTSSYIRNEHVQRLIEKNRNAFWIRRYIKGVSGKKVNANWRFEIPEIIWRAIEGKSDKVQRLVYARDTNFDQYVAKQLHKHESKSNIYWGFQGSCHNSLKESNRLGMISICELATAHVVAAKKILGEEAKLHPEWAHTIDNLLFPAKYEQRLEEEPFLAKKVIVASKFTQNTLIQTGINKSKIIYLPLGFDLANIPYNENRFNSIKNRPLKLLFVGTVTQRKGIKYLLNAMRILNSKDIELHIIGGIQGNETALKKYSKEFCYHPPISQQELFSQYAEYDAMVLPTIFEGFGLVIVEAMAAGLPVITTPHTIGPDFITHKKNGYIVPIRDTQSIVNAIESIRALNDDDFFEMKREARKASLTYSWNVYQQKLKVLIDDLQNNKNV